MTDYAQQVIQQILADKRKCKYLHYSVFNALLYITKKVSKGVYAHLAAVLLSLLKSERINDDALGCLGESSAEL
ncbi:hypothetical protein GCM10028817_34240 [Spirosoma pomorum]